MTKACVLKRQGKRRVLVAEREPIVRFGLSQLITLQPDLEVCGEQDNSNRIVEEIGIKRADLLIVTLFLIPAGIFQLLETILVQHSKLKVVVLSRHDEFLYAGRVLKFGAKVSRRKEVSTEHMLPAMGHVLRRKVFVSSELKNFWWTHFREHFRTFQSLLSTS